MVLSTDRPAANPWGGEDSQKLVIAEMLRLFRGDSRRVMQQLKTGAYGILHTGPLKPDDLRRHLQGDVSVSIYLLNENRCCAVLCFDIDIPKIEIPDNSQLREQKKRSEFLPVVARLIDRLRTAYNIPESSILLEDTGGRGYHVWLFLEEPRPADLVVTFAREIQSATEIETLEIFPPSATHGPTGFSKSNVRLPLGFHRKYPASRSAFLDLQTFNQVPLQEVGPYLQRIKYVTLEALNESRAIHAGRVHKILSRLDDTSLASSGPLKKPQIVAELGDTLNLCPALSGLAAKARRDGHLLHHERVALAIILNSCSDGEAQLHKILRYCGDYSREESQKHYKSLSAYYPISCRSLQGSKYGVCHGWCSSRLESAAAEGLSPTPLWFSRLKVPTTDIRLDGYNGSLVEPIASIENLHHAWLQALAQARERDVFEDILAFKAFDDHLWAHLSVLREELLAGKYRHQAFRTLPVPKKKGDTQNTRPMCWGNPWDSVVMLALLNVIGPAIDSTFHPNALGNRLVHGPKSDPPRPKGGASPALLVVAPEPVNNFETLTVGI